MTVIDDKLRRGVEALEAGRPELARHLFKKILEQDRENEAAWLWLSKAVPGTKQRRHCLEKVLKINQDNEEAKALLAALDRQETDDLERSVDSLVERDETVPQTPRVLRTASGERRWVRLREDPNGKFPKRGCLVPGLNPKYRFKSGELEAESQLSAEEYRKLVRRQRELPAVTMRHGERTWWMYKDRFYWEDKNYRPREVQALVERSLHNALHPHSFTEFIGQDQTKREILDTVEASAARDSALGHILICGPSGIGKKALVRALAYEINVRTVVTVGDVPPVALLMIDGGHKTMAQYLSKLDQNRVLRIDDIGSLDLKPQAIDVLCHAMLKKEVELPQGTGTASHGAKYDFSESPFTLIATARRMSAVPESMLVLFHQVFHLTPYTVPELGSLIIRGAEVLRLDIEDSAAELIGECADGRTGLATQLLERAGQFASAIRSDTIKQEIAQEVLWRLGLLPSTASAAEEEPFERIAIPSHVRQAVLARDDYLCRYCGRRSQTMEVDHIIPVSQGGKSTLRNLVTACRECNRRKAARTPEEAGMDVLSVRTQRRDWE